MGVRIRREAAMRGDLFLLPLATLVSPLLCQLKFSGGVSSDSNSNSPSPNRNNRPTDVDEKFFLGGDTPSLTGNQALDGGIVGLGLGALGAAVLGPTIQGALNGAQQQPGLLLWKEKKAGQLWRTNIRRRRSGYRRRREVFPSHRSRLHLQWKEKEASSRRE